MNRMEAILVRAVTKIAHKACRNGEDGTRAWPALDKLPEPESWRCVGETYAPQIAAEILAEFLPSTRMIASLLRTMVRR